MTSRAPDVNVPMFTRRHMVGGFALGAGLMAAGAWREKNAAAWREKNAAANQLTPEQVLSSKLDELAQTYGADELSVAAFNHVTNQGFQYHPEYRGYEASIVKVSIALAVMRFQHEKNDQLTDEQKQAMKASIEQSDNDATSQLFGMLGTTNTERADFLNGTYQKMGVTNTSSSEGWGSNETNPVDQVQIARTVYDGAEWTNPNDVDYLRELMHVKDESQSWGVGALKESRQDDQDILCKNGWLPDTDNLWNLNTVGVAILDAGAFSLCAMTKGFEDQTQGEKLVSDAIAAVVEAMVNHNDKIQ
ncbi:serine hydrolase [Rothia terrae]|uniref:serine hydrolase n=1 Tax=Rothia terrae TaxID=396015 RepID=UPI00340169A9